MKISFSWKAAHQGFPGFGNDLFEFYLKRTYVRLYIDRIFHTVTDSYCEIFTDIVSKVKINPASHFISYLKDNRG